LRLCFAVGFLFAHSIFAGRSALTFGGGHTMKSQFAFARVAYGSVAIFFWMAGAGQVIIAFTPRGQKGSLFTALIFAVIGIIPFLRYRYWSRRAAESNARPQKQTADSR